jgi:ankyrin repeat protein
MKNRSCTLALQFAQILIVCCCPLTVCALPHLDEPSAALMQSTMQGDLRGVKAALFDRGDVNTRDQYRRTPLMYAASDGHSDIVRVLLSQHANPRLKSFDGYTALIMAAAKGHAEIVKMLLARGANPEDRNGDNVPVLHFACAEGGNAPTVEALLARGAKPNAVVRDGTTALMTAARCGQLEIVQLLLRRGAVPDAQDSSGRTAERLAQQNGFPGIANEIAHAAIIRTER